MSGPPLGAVFPSRKSFARPAVGTRIRTENDAALCVWIVTELDFPLGMVSSKATLPPRGERHRGAERESERSDQAETHTAMLTAECRARDHCEAAAVQCDARERGSGGDCAREQRGDHADGDGL